MTGLLGGCDLHGQTREGVLAAWRHTKTIKALEEGTPRLVYCVCCDSVAVAGEDAGVVVPPTLCKACKETTPEQLDAIIARLNEGAEVTV